MVFILLHMMTGKSSFTYFKVLQIYPAVMHHLNEEVCTLLIQQDVDGHVPHSSIENICKYVDISERVHHYGDDLRRRRTSQ